MSHVITLGEFVVQNQDEFPYAKGDLSSLLSAIRLAAKVLNSQINKAGLVDNILGSVGLENVQGEEQKKLDVYANELFVNALKARNQVCGIASEEEEKVIILENETGLNGKYVVLIDPIDGSSNIDVNVSIGTIFAIYRRLSPIGNPATAQDFLQRGREQVAAGYVIYGSSTMLVYTTGHGVNGFTYDPSIGVFYLSHPRMKIPETGEIYSINEGNYPYFSPAVKSYVDYCKSIDKDDHRPYNARYIGSMIADLHRTFLKGGIYMYPNSSKAPNGKLRLLYECNPMAFLVEQAGGRATNGLQPILDMQPSEVHQRTPVISRLKIYGGKVRRNVRNEWSLENIILSSKQLPIMDEFLPYALLKETDEQQLAPFPDRSIGFDVLLRSAIFDAESQAEAHSGDRHQDLRQDKLIEVCHLIRQRNLIRTHSFRPEFSAVEPWLENHLKYHHILEEENNRYASIYLNPDQVNITDDWSKFYNKSDAIISLARDMQVGISESILKLESARKVAPFQSTYARILASCLDEISRWDRCITGEIAQNDLISSNG